MSRDRRVHYQYCIDRSKAALARLGEAIVDHGAIVLNSFTLDPGPRGTIILMLKMTPEAEEGVRALLKPISSRYSPPVWFDNGTLNPCFGSPEEEIGARQKD